MNPFKKYFFKDEEETEDEEYESKIGSIEHVESIHTEILRLVSEITRSKSGRNKLRDKLLLYRNKYPRYFRSLELYNAVVEKFSVNCMDVKNRQMIHELFDWSNVADCSKFGIIIP